MSFSNQPYSWLDVGADVTQALASLPNRIKEAAEMDRRIRSNELRNDQVYGAVNEMAVRISEDQDLSNQVAQNLGLDPTAYTPQELHQRIMQIFPEAAEEEDAGQYTNRMVQSYGQFVENAGRGMDSRLFASIMMNPVTGVAGQGALETLGNIENREAKAEFDRRADTAETVADFEEAGRVTGQDYRDDPRFQEFHRNDVARQASDLVNTYAQDINAGRVQDVISTLGSQGVPDEVLDEVYSQINAAAEYNRMIGDIANAEGRLEVDRMRAQLDREQFNEQRRRAREQAQREAAEGENASVNLVEDDIANLIIDVRERITQYSNVDDDESRARLSAAESELSVYERMLTQSRDNNGIYETTAEAIHASIQPDMVLADMVRQDRTGNGLRQRDIIDQIESKGYTIYNRDDAREENSIIEFVDRANNLWFYNPRTGAVMRRTEGADTPQIQPGFSNAPSYLQPQVGGGGGGDQQLDNLLFN